MTVAKRKLSITLDEDLVAELESADETVSAQINQAVRDRLNSLRQQRLLREMLDGLDAIHGPVDEDIIAKYDEMMR